MNTAYVYAIVGGYLAVGPIVCWRVLAKPVQWYGRAIERVCVSDCAIEELNTEGRFFGCCTKPSARRDLSRAHAQN